jgi:hypothetical protein
MSCKQIMTGVESFSFAKVDKSNITEIGLNGYQFFLQGCQTSTLVLSFCHDTTSTKGKTQQ